MFICDECVEVCNDIIRDQPRVQAKGCGLPKVSPAPAYPVLAEPVSNQRLSCVTFLVRDYDEAIAYFKSMLGFVVLEDTPLEPGKRWVVVSPSSPLQMRLLLARASTAAQEACVGKQGGGRVFLFLYTDDFRRDYAAMKDRGVKFREEPRREPYGTVAVFEDLYGNKWDLVELRRGPGPITDV